MTKVVKLQKIIAIRQVWPFREALHKYAYFLRSTCVVGRQKGILNLSVGRHFALSPLPPPSPPPS